MSWTTIDKDACTLCGTCVTRCPCFRKKGEEILTRADEATCNLCGHCIALCPEDAITHQLLDMKNFPSLEPRPAWGPEEFLRFVRQRRSHRHFEDKAIPRKALETLVELSRYSPTGSNWQTTGLLLIEDRGRIKRLSDHTVDFFEQRIPEIERDIAERREKGVAIPEELRPMYGMVEVLKRVVKARQFGLEVMFHSAPAVLMFYAPASASTPKDDCVIASTTVTLGAMTLGLETCYIGLFEFAANTYPPIVEDLKLPPDDKVYSVLVAGYPKLKFRRTVDRKPMRVRWE